MTVRVATRADWRDMIRIFNDRLVIIRPAFPEQTLLTEPKLVAGTDDSLEPVRVWLVDGDPITGIGTFADVGDALLYDFIWSELLPFSVARLRIFAVCEVGADWGLARGLTIARSLHPVGSDFGTELSDAQGGTVQTQLVGTPPSVDATRVIRENSLVDARDKARDLVT